MFPKLFIFKPSFTFILAIKFEIHVSLYPLCKDFTIEENFSLMVSQNRRTDTIDKVTSINSSTLLL